MQATTKENAAWKTTMKREVQLGEAKEQYNKDLKQFRPLYPATASAPSFPNNEKQCGNVRPRLAAEETQVRGAANKVRRC